ncbi:MAG TPA: cupin domain-containing protein [Methylomirabilota bacterium]|jgi:mannose-6-phosphate isomerase-like protein (cupin superfamily)|nr:cupin domain-containing protein [Methylomirabilota bacterium]
MEVFKEIATQLRFAAEKMQKVNLFDTERMFCDVYCFEPGQEQTPHAHKGSDKVYYVLQGTARIRIAQDTKELGPGGIALAPAGADHGVRNPGPERLTVLVFMAPKP